MSTRFIQVLIILVCATAIRALLVTSVQKPTVATDCPEHGEIQEAQKRFPNIFKAPYLTTALGRRVSFAEGYSAQITDDGGQTYVDLFGDMSPNVFYAVRGRHIYTKGGENHSATFKIAPLIRRVLAEKPDLEVDFSYDSTDNAFFCKTVLEQAHHLICASPVAQMPEHYPIVGLPNVYFERSLQDASPAQFKVVAWENKYPKVYWRGSFTGTPYGDFLSMPRALAYKLSLAHPELVDLKFTHLDDQLMERYMGNHFTSEEQKLVDGVKASTVTDVDFKTTLPQYRYLLNVDGIVVAFRLRDLLLSGSVVLHYMTDTAEFFFRDLQPWTHFVPVKTMDDIPNIVATLEANPSRAQKIAAAGKAYAEKFLTMQGQDCYFKRFLEFVSNRIKYRPATPEQLLSLGFHKDY